MIETLHVIPSSLFKYSSLTSWENIRNPLTTSIYSSVLTEEDYSFAVSWTINCFSLSLFPFSMYRVPSVVPKPLKAMINLPQRTISFGVISDLFNVSHTLQDLNPFSSEPLARANPGDSDRGSPGFRPSVEFILSTGFSTLGVGFLSSPETMMRKFSA